jgi:hypothetical protein
MKNLLRCLALTLVLLPAVAAKAQQPSASSLESACARGGHCKISGAFCVVNLDCGSTGGICVCD